MCTPKLTVLPRWSQSTGHLMCSNTVMKERELHRKRGKWKGLTCLLSPSLQGDSSTWEPGKRVYTDKHSCCWRTWWLYVYVHSCTEEEKERWWESSVDSCYSFMWKTNTLAWILPLTKSSTNLTDFKRHQKSLGFFKPPQGCSCHWGTAGTKKMSAKAAGICFMR